MNSERKHTNERKIVCRAHHRLRAAGVVVHCEVPLLGRSVDLVMKRGRHIITIEFKLHDWRRAIKQARDHRLAADFAYICMPRRQATQALQDALREDGIGLFYYIAEGRWPFELAVKARRSQEIWSVARRNLLSYLRSTSPGENV